MPCSGPDMPVPVCGRPRGRGPAPLQLALPPMGCIRSRSPAQAPELYSTGATTQTQLLAVLPARRSPPPTHPQLLGAGLRISCATPVLGPCLGAVGVGAASVLSGHMSRHTKRQMEAGKGPLQALASPFWHKFDGEEALLDAVSGLTLFKVRGGHAASCMAPGAPDWHAASCWQSCMAMEGAGHVVAAHHVGMACRGMLLACFWHDRLAWCDALLAWGAAGMACQGHVVGLAMLGRCGESRNDMLA